MISFRARKAWLLVADEAAAHRRFECVVRRALASSVYDPEDRRFRTNTSGLSFRGAGTSPVEPSVDLVAVLAPHLPSGGVLGLITLVIVLGFVCYLSSNPQRAKSASIVLLALRGKAHPDPEDAAAERKPPAGGPGAARAPRKRRRRRRRRPRPPAGDGV